MSNNIDRQYKELLGIYSFTITNHTRQSKHRLATSILKYNNMASNKTLLIPIVNEILLDEIGEAGIDPIAWTKVSDSKYAFTVDINGNMEEVRVDFQTVDNDVQKQYLLPPKYRNLPVQNVAYGVSGSERQFAKSDMRTLLTIMSTIVDIIKDRINTEDIQALYIKATEKEIGSDDISQKSNLYKAYIEKQLGLIPGYGVDTYRDGFIIIKVK